MESIPTSLDDNSYENMMNHSEKLPWWYIVELWIYGVAIVSGVVVSIYTAKHIKKRYKRLAARHLSYKISLTVADVIVLFIYAPTQMIWIYNYWWFGGDSLCRVYKFINTFGFNLTGNMQVLIAFDRLYSMTKMNRPQGNTSSSLSTRAPLLIAWILAIGCALPQFFTFELVYVPNINKPQCVSVWQICRTTLEEREIAAEGARRLAEWNASITPPPDFMPPGHSFCPGTTLEEIEASRENILYYETVYNIIHLSSMVFLPYTFEIICYLLMANFLNHAKRGDFYGLQALLRKMFVNPWTVRRTRPFRRPSRPETSHVSEEETNLTTLAHVPERSSVRSLASSPTPPLQFAAPIPAQFKRKCTAPEPRNIAVVAVRSSSVPNVNSLAEVETRLIEAPWIRTVVQVRKKTRRQIQLMLTLNLLFWAPYFIHSIVNSLIDFKYYYYFQFAGACMCLNAVSNILL